MRGPIGIQRRTSQHPCSIRTEELREIRALTRRRRQGWDSVRRHCPKRGGSRSARAMFGPSILKDGQQISADTLQPKQPQSRAHQQDLSCKNSESQGPTRAGQDEPPKIEKSECHQPATEGTQVPKLKWKLVLGLRENNKPDRQGQDHQRWPPTNRSDGSRLSRHTLNGPWTPGFVTRESRQIKRAHPMQDAPVANDLLQAITSRSAWAGRPRTRPCSPA